MQLVRSALDQIEAASPRLAATTAELVDHTDRILEALNTATTAFDEVAKLRSDTMMKELTGIVGDIQSVAKEAKVVSFNAQVMAARAGQHGREFAVVANVLSDITGEIDSLTRKAAALAERPDGRARSIEAGHRWADALAPPRPDAEPDSDADTGDASGVDTLVRVLDDLGFEPLVAGDDEIRLRACPFRDAARDHPQVVCSVHRGVIEQLLLTRGSDRRADLLPFVEPELCLVTLAAPGGRTLDE